MAIRDNLKIAINNKNEDFFRDCGFFKGYGHSDDLKLLVSPYSNNGAKYASHSNALKPKGKVKITWQLELSIGSPYSASTIDFGVGIGEDQSSLLSNKSHTETINPYVSGGSTTNSYSHTYDLSDLSSGCFVVLYMNPSGLFNTSDACTVRITDISFE